MKNIEKLIKQEAKSRGFVYYKSKYYQYGTQGKRKRYIDIKCKSCNHRWDTAWDNFNRGKGCPKCYTKKTKIKESDIKNIINKKGGKLLKSWREYHNKSQRLYVKIKCNSCKNEWAARFYAIKKHSWCPKCSRPGSKTQKILFDIMQECYPNYTIEYNYTGFDWLGRQEIDIFIYNKDRSFSLAIEYDGRQHFMPVRYGGMSKARAKTAFVKRKELDKLKNKKIKKNKEDVKYFIRFNYRENINEETVMGKLIENNIPINIGDKSE
jgi:Zn finger protein HypA/HybF involved in hydrogenase expression